MSVRAAGRDARSAVLAIGLDQLPQSPHLSGRCSRSVGSCERSTTRFVRRACCFLVPPRVSPCRLSCSSRPIAARGCSVECRTPVEGRSRGRDTNRTRRRSRARGSDVPLHSEADALPREADRLLLARFAPACMLVNQALTILQFRGQTGPYLEPAGGPPSFDLRRVLRPELLAHDPSCNRGNQQDRRRCPPRHAARSSARSASRSSRLAGSSGGQSFLILFDDGSRPAVDRSVPCGRQPR